jgi:hypothetical protein
MMTIFEPLFLLLALGTVLTLVTVMGLMLFGRFQRAWRILRRLLIGAAVYMAIVVTVSVFTPRDVRPIGEMNCFDDWCFTVRQVVRDTPASYDVTLTLSSRARRVPQGERGTHLYIVDSAGHRYEPVAETVPFDYQFRPAGGMPCRRTRLISAWSIFTIADFRLAGSSSARTAGYTGRAYSCPFPNRPPAPAEPEYNPPMNRHARVILLAGAVAGTLDLTGAIVVSWLRASVEPMRVMQSIAAGLLGADAYTGGASTAALGVALHYMIATSWAAIFYMASRRVKFLTGRWAIAGPLYGIGVYAFMNFVVLPLSALPPPKNPPTLTGRLIGLSLIMFCIGLPIAAIVKRAGSRG